MPTQNIIETILVARDQASSVLANFGANVQKVSQNATQATKSVKDINPAVGSLLNPTLIAATAIGGLGLAIGKLALDAGKFQSVQTTYGRLATSIGQDSRMMLENIVSASKGTISQFDAMTSANTAMLLINKEALGDASKTIPVFAAMARAAARATGQDTTYMFESIVKGVGRASPLILDNLGINLKLSEAYEIYAKKLGKTSDELNKTEQQQAIVNEVMKVAPRYLETIGVTSGGLTYRWEVLTAQLKNMKDQIGMALLPAFQSLIVTLTGPATAAAQWITAHLKEIQITILGVVTILHLGVQMLVGGIRVALSALASLFTLNFKYIESEANNFIGETLNIWTGFGDTMNSIIKGSNQQVVTDIKGMANDVANGLTDAQIKAQKEMTRETKNFERQMKDRERSFRDSLARLVKSHQEKVTKTEGDLKDETESFEGENKKRKEDYDKAITDMEDRGKERVNDYKQQIEEIKQEMEGETDKQKEESEKRIKKLEEKISKEQEATKKAVEERGVEYEKETQKVEKEHKKKVTDLEKTLNEEKEILKRHEKEVSEIKDLVAQDDITRLKVEYEEEKKQSEEQHKEKLLDIQEKGGELGTIGALSQTQGFFSGAASEQSRKTMGDSARVISDSFNSVLKDSMGAGAKEAGKEAMSNFFKGMKDWLGAEGGKALGSIADRIRESFGGKQISGFASALATAWGFARSLWPEGKQEGGPVFAGQPYLVGERGTETFVPATSGNIVPNKYSGGQPVNLNVYVGLYAGTNTEKRRIAEELLREIRYLARVTGKTPTEFLNQ